MQKILIANRGEIALRVMKSAKEMGIQTVAIYSEADRESPHVLYADEAVCVGPPPSNQSYLLGDKIIEICNELKVDGVHPGYGFLSENADFARKLRDAKIQLIGPSPEAMDIMGDKISSKNAVKKYGTPLVPGTEEAISDIPAAKRLALEIGYPIIIKASAGGGGKGMRIVQNEAEFEEQMDRAMSEARNSFGNDACFIEKYVTNPRHIEVQVLGDHHGNYVYVFERECSIQRRHQKVVEEAPSCILTPEIREKIGEAAINAAKSCNYTNAGTVEFIVDDKLNFYFLEMNTRLQVEHPVSEMISGLDLVKEQIKIARGEKLGFKQEDLKINGHALELRVYAEDPQNNFLPDIGKLEVYQKPEGLGIRVDDGFREGMDIPIYYDPMIAKLVAHGTDRADAINKMKRAIHDYKIRGVKTTLDFGLFVLNHPSFISGSFDTGFVDKFYKPEYLNYPVNEEQKEVLEKFFATFQQASPVELSRTPNKIASNWKKNRTIR
ncbi:MAG: acetyl-CoA carboxylase biotin carboxylase subunit [Chitinophagales bacterium]|jgi:acetyl-CoA carboxylase biotin carboxylase subunit|nr:acetyl-CoA carboxylase biotin carboxylase subunit [Sphingobacteriales bacterium]